jgi:DNA helicase HerA-like ATPase
MPTPIIEPAPADVRRRLQEDASRTGAPAAAAEPGEIGRTMFDLPGSQDNTITVLLGKDTAQASPAQALVRIVSRPDGRRYLGVVTAGPFAEPDSLRGDSTVLVAVATRGGDYLPPYHGRVQVTLLGEQLADGTLTPPRLRPLPHSPVYRLNDAESAAVLKAGGDLRLGLAVGHEAVVVGVPSGSKAVLPRHTAILGTTGGGKSTTVAGLVQQAQAAGMAVVLLDVEGEYTFLHEPTDNERMRAGLEDRGLERRGVPTEQMLLYHLVGRDTANPAHPNRRPFALQFARLSPYTVMEMLGLNDAQKDRFLFAYDLAKALLRDLGIFPQKDATAEARDKQERLLLTLDEFERGYPRLTLSLFLDVVGFCKATVNKTAFTPFNEVFRTDASKAALMKYLNPKEMPGSVSSWGKVVSLLWRMHRLKVFDRHGGGSRFLNYRELIQPGRVSVVDLSDAGMAELTNITIADLLRGTQEAQEEAYRAYEKAQSEGKPATAPPRVLLIIEESHEFLAEERVDKTPILFQQVARIAKRGRKRWLGLVFVTQLPQHLPRQLLALVNNYVLHKITDAQVIGVLRKTVSDMDEGLWTRLTGLAPGQAIVSFGHMTRPLLVAVDPAGAKLRLVD